MEVVAQGGGSWSGHVAASAASAVLHHKDISKDKFVKSSWERANFGEEQSETPASGAAALFGGELKCLAVC